jgi:adenylate kinase
MRLTMLGGPGSGKGTQGERLAEHFGVPHIASGDLLRAQVGAGTELGQQVTGHLDAGRLVPDELVFNLVLPAVLAAMEKAGGYVLDGFPRSVGQAVRMEELTAPVGAQLQRVVFLAVPEADLVQRLLDRAAEAGRSDDTLKVITDRLRVFQSETEPLVDYYRARGMLRTVAGNQPADEVTEQILAVL